MKIENIQEFQNKLLNRKEVVAVISYNGTTPKREDVKKEISGKIGSNIDNTILVKLDSSYGSNKLKCFVNIYKNKEDMKKTESSYILKRNGLLENKSNKDNKENKEKKKE